MSNMGERIQQIRRSLNMTQQEFGDIFGVKKSFICAVEKGDSKLSVDNLVKLLVNHNVNINYILGGQGNMFLEQKTDTKIEDLNSKIDKIFEILKRNNINWMYKIEKKTFEQAETHCSSICKFFLLTEFLSSSPISKIFWRCFVIYCTVYHLCQLLRKTHILK